MRITVKQASDFLKSRDNFLFLTHQSPDGDTIGSATALCYAIAKLGKKGKVICSDEIDRKYDYLFDGLDNSDFEVQTVVSVDVADVVLLGKLESYKDRIELCVDHHQTNKIDCERLCLFPDSASTAEIVFYIVKELGVEIDAILAEKIYTGVATDTGCFCFANTKADTHRVAAALIECGADIEKVNRKMFEEKSKSCVMLERLALETMEYHCDGKIAMMTVTLDMMEKSGAKENDLNGISSLPRQIEGVLAGVTIKEKDPGVYKVSVRTHAPIDAAVVCEQFGGGGHMRAAGCKISGNLQERKQEIVKAVEKQL